MVQNAGSATPVCGISAPRVPQMLDSFKCSQCLLQKSLVELEMKGAQQWCVMDSRSYQSLVGRWKANAKLRAWWQSLAAQQKATWFQKWQQLDPRRRFDCIQFVEKTIQCQESGGPEIDMRQRLNGPGSERPPLWWGRPSRARTGTDVFDFLDLPRNRSRMSSRSGSRMISSSGGR